jgi:hypothetical protein
MNSHEIPQRAFLAASFVQYLLQGVAAPEHREAITRILTRGELTRAKERQHRWEFLTPSARSSLR